MPQRFACTHLYTWVERGTVCTCPRKKQHNHPGRGLNVTLAALVKLSVSMFVIDTSVNVI